MTLGVYTLTDLLTCVKKFLSLLFSGWAEVFLTIVSQFIVNKEMLLSILINIVEAESSMH